jgi:hypothetical protein
MDNKRTKETGKGANNSQANWQGVDKDPQEEKGKSEKVTSDDIKGKKVDADPSEENKKH